MRTENKYRCKGRREEGGGVPVKDDEFECVIISGHGGSNERREFGGF
jgi:hypothetical protein